MYITDSQNSPLKNISDINGQLAYRGQLISGSAGTGSSNLPANATGYLYNDGNGNLRWETSDILKFSPLDIPGCIRWYSASNGVLNSAGNPCLHGEEVYVWKNLSQNPYISGELQTALYMRPTYLTGIPNSNFPVLDFQSSGSCTGLANLALEGLSHSFTIITKRNKKFTTGAANIYQIGNNSTTNRLTIHGPFANETTYFDAGNPSALRLNGNCQTNNSGQWDTVVGKRRQSSSEFLMNGRQYLSINSTSWPNFVNETGLLSVGTSFPPTDHNADANSYITDFIMYNRDLNAGELALIDQYLGKYI